MSTPIVVAAYFRPAPGQHDRVVEVLRPSIGAVHEEPGCELYAIHDAPDGTIVMIEKWSSVEELDEHGRGGAGTCPDRSPEGTADLTGRGDAAGAVTSGYQRARSALN
jgi:quinol monooxygenase YgiN